MNALILQQPSCWLIALVFATGTSIVQADAANPALAERLQNAQVYERTLPNGAKVTQIKFAGSLMPNAELGCVGMEQVTSQYNPPTLIYAAKKCVQQGDYAKAWTLFNTGTGYAYYDLKRLADRSTGGAKTVLIMNAMSDLNDVQRARMGQKFAELQTSEPAVKAYCAELTRLGPPTYDPQWAILHGLGVYQGSHDGPYLTDVDNKALWAEVLENRCTVKAQK